MSISTQFNGLVPVLSDLDVVLLAVASSLIGVQVIIYGINKVRELLEVRRIEEEEYQDYLERERERWGD